MKTSIQTITFIFSSAGKTTQRVVDLHEGIVPFEGGRTLHLQGLRASVDQYLRDARKWVEAKPGRTCHACSPGQFGKTDVLALTHVCGWHPRWRKLMAERLRLQD